MEKVSNYLIIDDIGSMSDKDFRASMNTVQPYIESLHVEEHFLMIDFIRDEYWNGNYEPSNAQIDKIRYLIRRDFEPSHVIILCYEQTKDVNRAIETWTEKANTHLSLYIRSSRRFIKDYLTPWDTLTIDTYGDYDNARRYVNKWYRPLGIILSAPPLSDYQPENDITTYGKRHIHYSVSNNHTTRPTTTAIKYHINQTAIASDKEIAIAEKRIQWTLHQLDIGQLYQSDILAENWYFCPYCGEPIYNSETSHIIDSDGLKMTCGQLQNECNECHRKFTFNRFNRPIQL